MIHSGKPFVTGWGFSGQDEKCKTHNYSGRAQLGRITIQARIERLSSEKGEKNIISSPSFIKKGCLGKTWAERMERRRRGEAGKRHHAGRRKFSSRRHKEIATSS